MNIIKYKKSVVTALTVVMVVALAALPLYGRDPKGIDGRGDHDRRQPGQGRIVVCPR